MNRKKLLTALFIAVPLMFGFAYALVPIYNWACIQLGANGKLMTKPQVYDAAKIKVDPTRTISVRFLTDVKSNVPWEFKPQHQTVQIHPGELVEEKMLAVNLSDTPMTVRVVVNTIPAHAVKYVHEVLSCFCLKTHHLEAGEQVLLPVGFYIDSDIPHNIHHVIMSYTLFKTKDIHA